MCFVSYCVAGFPLGRRASQGELKYKLMLSSSAQYRIVNVGQGCFRCCQDVKLWRFSMLTPNPIHFLESLRRIHGVVSLLGCNKLDC